MWSKCESCSDDAAWYQIHKQFIDRVFCSNGILTVKVGSTAIACVRLSLCVAVSRIGPTSGQYGRADARNKLASPDIGRARECNSAAECGPRSPMANRVETRFCSSSIKTNFLTSEVQQNIPLSAKCLVWFGWQCKKQNGLHGHACIQHD